MRISLHKGLLSYLILLSAGMFIFNETHAAKQPVTPAAFTISFVVSDYNGFGVSCNGSSDGFIDLTINGVTGPFDVLWSTGATSEDIGSLVAGNYVVTIIDAVQDTVIDSVLITEPAIVDFVFNATSDITCNGLSDGAVDITGIGGTGVYTFLWSEGSTTEDISGLGPGSYTITVTDNNGCSVEGDTVIIEPDVIDPNISIVDANAAPDGEASCLPSGGTGGYSYLWSTGSTASFITGLLPGNYTVTVTDANLCSVTQVATINNALGICAVVTDSVFDVTCNGLNDGAIYISTFAAIDPITYQWSNGAITEDITGLGPGTYTVTITDVILCTATQSFVISEPDLLIVTLTPAPETCAANNGSVSSGFTGGTGSVDYLWSNAATTPGISGLNNGTYTVTVTDQNGCTDVESALVSEIIPPQVTIDSTVDVSCFGGSNGAVYTTITNGTSPYSVIWSNGSTSEDITGLVSGTYTITVTDADLCTATTSAIITQPAAALNDSVQTTNPTCGNNNGSITVFPFGGTSPYTYLWSNLQTTQTISGLAPGTYTVTITDANLCTRQRVASIINIAGPVATVDSVRAVGCFGQSTGGVFISVSGGTSPFGYLWSNGAITQDIQNVAAGTYTVTVTDANSCTSTVSGIVTQPAAALNDSVQTTNPTCGNNNGSITVFPFGGTSPYTYLWSNLQTTQTISGLAPGTYTVTITDANLCTRQRVAVISNLGGPSAVIDSIRPVRCFGQANGGVFISVTGGATPYGYLWSNGAVTQDIQTLLAGTYTVTVTDANSCTSVVSGVVTQPSGPLVDSVQTTRPTCGNSNGSITVFPYGGTSPYTYLWSNLQTTQTISGLAAGGYTVTITDANLCTRVRVASISNIAGPTASLDSVRAVRCFGQSTGGVFISVSGGTTPYGYLWSNGALTQDIQNVPAGTYTVTVTDANSCTSVVSDVVSQPVSALNDSVQVTNATCGSANGVISVFPYGGTPGYTYLWNNLQTTQSISNLSAGSYTVTITDANSCTRVRSVGVSGIGAPVVVIDSVQNVKCFNGSTGGIFISVTGGTPNYTYSWSNGVFTQDNQGIPSGIYTVTVTDANSCTATISDTVSQPSAALNDSVQTVRPTCGNSNGSITIFPYGGTPPYTYLWSNGLTTQTISGLAAGGYTVTITDANLCTRQRVASIPNIAGPLAVIDSVRNVRCFGGLTGGIFISVTGGTAPISYLWSNGALTQDISNVGAGIYTVTVTDDNGCTVILSDTVTQPPVLNDSLQVTNASCGASTGSATVFPFGGTGPYTLLWSTGSVAPTIFNLNSGNYTVTITDALGCTLQDIATISSTGGPVVTIDSIRNVKCFGAATGGIFITVTGGTIPYGYFWSTGAVSQDLVGVGVGTYTVTITDDNNCTVMVSGNITQPPLLNDTISTVSATCGLSNGSATTHPFGGVAPYTYLWNGGQSTQTITGLSAGVYTVTVTDFNGCTRIATDTVLTLNGPLVVVDSITDINCFGSSSGAIYITASGGTGVLSYLWSNSAITPDLVGVATGTYTVTVTDQNNCSASVTATINQSPQIQDSSNVTPEACNSLNGAINLFPYGGVPPYTFLWNTGAVSQNLSGLQSGTYTVTITDSLGCEKISVIIVPQSGAPQIILDSLNNVSCNGFSDGGIFISVSSGTGPYSYNWSNSVVTQDNNNLQVGNYSVIVTDVFLCQDTAFYTITEPDLLEDSLNFTPATCALANGTATVYPYGGTLPYGYLWSDGQVTATAINLGPGMHTVTVTDGNLCQIVETVIINAIPVQVITNDSIVDVSCFGLSDGGIYISVSGGTTPYDYLWSNTAISEDIVGLTAGTYTVTVTDDNSCPVTQVFTVNEPSQLMDSTEVFASTCGQANGAATIYPYGGTAPYAYLWSNGSITQSISGIPSLVYTVTVTDFNGCTVIDSVNVGDIGGPSVVADSIINVTCNGGNDGAIYVSVISGTSPFIFAWSNSAITEDITGLSAGVYSLTITDQSNCQQFISFTVNEPDPIQDSALIVPATCGASNGSITIFPYGGTAPYTFLWSNGTTFQTASGLSAATYTVTVTDSNSCTGIFQYVVNNFGGPVIIPDSFIQVACAGDSTGAINITVTDGLAPYTYNWSNFATTEDLTNLPEGTYTVTVSDLNGCTAVFSTNISQPAPVNVAFTISPANCNATNGTITSVISGGVPGYTLEWNTGAATPDISNLAAGVYTLTVTDSNACVNEFTAAVSNISAPEITVVDSGLVSCYGLNDGFITVSVTGGALPYTYEWANSSQTGNQLTALTANTYTLTITDDLGCVAIREIVITQPPQITINGIVPQLNDTFNVSCFGSIDGSISLFVAGGTAPYNYLWSNFATTDSIGGLSAGNYTVTITDANNCTTSQSFTLTQPPLLVSNAGPDKVICGINSDTLAAVPPAFGTGYWMVISGSATFTDSTQYNTVITDLTNGVNVYQWVVTDGVCSAFSQVVITFSTQISAIAGVDKDICVDSVLLTATAPQFGYGYWQIVSSTGTIEDTSRAVTSVTGLNPGANVFRWFVLNGTCSDSADITIFVNDPSECINTLEIPTGFTPNGDGKNDFFIIKGVDDYPENTLVVFNRWGNKVYEKSGYANDWEGTNDSGDPLVDGTYFIIFKVRSINKIITSYVDLRR